MSETLREGSRARAVIGAAFMRLVALRERMGRLSGWRALAANIVAGAVAAASFAPVYFWPGLPVGFAVFFWSLDAARVGPKPARAGALRGWAFGFGYFLVSTYWMSFSMLVQAEQFAWMMPIAILGMPTFLGVFIAAAGAIAARVSGGSARRMLALIFAFSLMEYARGHVLTGLPWNLVGQALAAQAAPIQLAAYIGPYGLSLVLIAIALLPALAGYAPGPKRAFLPILVSAASVFGLYGLGLARLAFHPIADRTDAVVRVVQPSIPQREKIDPDFYWANLDRNLALSAAPTMPDVETFILWGENGAPLLGDFPQARDYISARLPAGSTLLAGAVRQIEKDGVERYTNGLVAVDADSADVLDVYDKHHLVPFGEYLPFETPLRAIGLSQLAPFEDGLVPGPGPRTLDIAGVRLAPMICYETIFPGSVYPRGDRPEWIAIVTNDGWYGDSSGPRQHLDQARLRAVENGLPIARAANTGVSTMIDPYGRYRARIDLYQEGYFDAVLPKPASATLYSMFGDALYALLMLILGAMIVAWARLRALTARLLAH